MSQPNPIPINALFLGDFVTQLVVVLDTDTIRELADKVAHHVIGRRIPPCDAPMVVYLDGGRTLPMDVTVAQAGIAPLQNVNVRYVG